MKITKIEIKDFHQFKDLTIDLTYPKGHEKEGQPLDKVCFIGQSGTGKTSLLEFIPRCLAHYMTPKTSMLNNSYTDVDLTIVYGLSNEFIRRYHVTANSDSSFSAAYFTREIEGTPTNDYGDVNWNNFLDEIWKKRYSTRMIYFPSDINYSPNEELINKHISYEIIDFSRENISVIWNTIRRKIKEHQEQEINLRLELAKIIEESEVDIEKVNNSKKKLEDWKLNEPSPIQKIADECLDQLLHHFQLKVKTDLDAKSMDKSSFIRIEDFSGNEIPNAFWSTGTKQIIITSLPLYTIKPRNTIVLFDEPERSLYPDMQRLVVDYYQSLTNNCQLFFATHSPIIASSFDPWEIVELKFDNEGHVYRELYYEGENNVDNYKWNPKYMRWDDILQRIFDMENDGSDDRKKKLNMLARLNVKYQKLKDKGQVDSEEAKQILTEISELQKLLSWPTNYAEN